MPWNPGHGQPRDRLRDERLDRKLGLGRAPDAARDAPTHHAEREVVPVGSAEGLDETGELAAIRAHAVVEGDDEGDLAVPRLATRVAQIPRRLRDRRLEIVEPAERAEVMERGRDRDLLGVLGRQRRDRADEVVEAVRVVAIALERRVVSAPELPAGIEDLVD